MFDCHTHTNFSTDSEMTAEKACEKAIELKLDGIAFTDHLDHDFPNMQFIIDFDEYSAYMDKIKIKYKGRLNVLKGIEVGIQPHVIQDSRQVVEGYDFDFVIMSIHVIDRMDASLIDYFRGKTKKQADIRYLKEILDTMNMFADFDVLGHIGYIRRYSCYDDKTLKYSDYAEIIDEILNKVISLGKGIEVNTSGYRSGLGSSIPDFDIVKRYKELGGEIITVGSDSHYVEHIASGFKEAREMLLEAGFKYTTHFEGRKPVFDKL